MPYIYRITRRDSTNRQPARAGASVSAIRPKAKVVEPSYRDLQAQAKELGIPGNQTADDLKKAIEEAGNG